MAKWFVRTRGRVIGPFAENALRDMRAARQLQAYDEVSKDQMSWTAIDLSPIFGPPDPGPSAMPMPNPATTSNRPLNRTRTNSWSGPKLWWMLGGLTAALLLGLGILLVVVPRGRKQTSNPTSASAAEIASVPHGVIRFSSNVSAADRDTVLSESIGFVVAGETITSPDGTQFDLAESTGTGFVVSTDGHLITNLHVVQGVVSLRRSPARVEVEQKQKIKIEPKLWVFFGRKRKYEADLIHTSEDYDLAILKIAQPTAWHFGLCNSPVEDVPKLDYVSSLGYPGIDRDPLTKKDQLEQRLRQDGRGPVQSAFPESAFELSKRDGSITKRSERKKMEAGQQESAVLQHSAQIFGGNSGGPLITRSGQVLGINTWNRTRAVRDNTGKVVATSEVNINYALTLPQLRGEIDKHVPGVIWQPLAAE